MYDKAGTEPNPHIPYVSLAQHSGISRDAVGIFDYYRNPNARDVWLFDYAYSGPRTEARSGTLEEITELSGARLRCPYPAGQHTECPICDGSRVITLSQARDQCATCHGTRYVQVRVPPLRALLPYTAVIACPTCNSAVYLGQISASLLQSGMISADMPYLWTAGMFAAGDFDPMRYVQTCPNLHVTVGAERRGRVVDLRLRALMAGEPVQMRGAVTYADLRRWLEILRTSATNPNKGGTAAPQTAQTPNAQDFRAQLHALRSMEGAVYLARHLGDHWMFAATMLSHRGGETMLLLLHESGLWAVVPPDVLAGMSEADAVGIVAQLHTAQHMGIVGPFRGATETPPATRTRKPNDPRNV